MPPEWEEVRRWLEKAQHDRTVSDLALRHTPPVTDAAAFHAQQAAEKLLKAFLTFQTKEFEKIHDLGELVDCCCRHHAGFDDWREAVSELTPYAVRFRYPGPADPSVEQAEQAVQLVGELYRFVSGLLPAEITDTGHC